MAYGVYSDRGYREHILERNKNTNKTEVFAQEDQSFTGRKTFLSGVTTSDLEVQTVEVSDSLKVKGKDITEIDYLPNDVSKENKLTTEDFVNSSIATNTANFLGTFNTLEEIEALTAVTNNDYAFWKTTDTLGSVVFKRYKYSADEQLWKFEYDLNNSSFTAKQWEAINSGITAELVAKIDDVNEKNVIDDTKTTNANAWSAAKTQTEIDARHKYSTEEKVIGKWIDGKPIYRKVFYSPTNWSNGTIVGNIGNVDVVININSTSCTNNGNWFTGYNVPTLENTAYVQPDGSVVVARAGTFVNNIKGLVIVEYTKTTD